MPEFVEPTIFLIGKTQLDHDAIGDWLEHIGAENFFYDVLAPDGATLSMLAGKRCYLSFDVNLNPNLKRVRSDLVGFIDNILSVGHGSVMEHTFFNFAIEGVSRVLTHELVRHRVGVAISQESGRYCRPTEKGIKFWMPGIFLEDEDDSPELAEKKRESRLIISEAVDYSEGAYRDLEKVWDKELNSKSFKKKKRLTSAFRRILPNGQANGLVWSCNIRTLRFVLEKRLDAAAEEEIILLASLLLRKMQEVEPECFKDFHYDEKKACWVPKYSKV